jgi:putative DNA primase/helicase
LASGGAALSLEQEGRGLVQRLGGRWEADGGMCRCPAHDDRTPSLSVRPGRTRLLFHCFAGCDSSDVLRALESGGLLRAGAAGAAVPARTARDRSAAALRIWSEARSIRGTPAEHYLAGRGLRTDSPQLRFHARTPFGCGRSAEHRPALIAAVHDEAGLVAIQRTFIDNRASGVARGRRCSLGRLGSGAVRLGGVSPVLGLAEGIETALSASALFEVPCWASLGGGRFGSIALPATIERLLLFLDNDSAGRRSEALARSAFPRVEIEAFYPEASDADWNDVLRTGACPATHGIAAAARLSR